MRKRAEQKGGAFDSYIRDEFKVFSPKEGDHCIRILPPTWEDAEHYGLDIWIHYGIGADKQSYLCLEKHGQGSCPMCDERRQLEAEEAEYARSLAPQRRILTWIINRDEEEAGPQVYPMPMTLDRDVAKLSIVKRTGEALLIDHHERGYDVDFSRSGSDIKTKYSGVAIAREMTPLSEDERQRNTWLKFIVENPLPEILRFYEENYIKRVFQGSAEEDTPREKEKEEENTDPEDEVKTEEAEENDDFVIEEEEEQEELEPEEEEQGEEEKPQRQKPEEEKPSHRRRLQDLRNRKGGE